MVLEQNHDISVDVSQFNDRKKRDSGVVQNSPSLERGEVLEMDLVLLELYRACLKEVKM